MYLIIGGQKGNWQPRVITLYTNTQTGAITKSRVTRDRGVKFKLLVSDRLMKI